MPFSNAVIISALNFLHHSCTVLEANLVGSSQLSGGSLTHAVKYLVEYINLLLAQLIFKRYAELAPLVRELSGVDFTLSVIVHRIDHLYSSFRFNCCKTNRPNFTKHSLLRCCLRHLLFENFNPLPPCGGRHILPLFSQSESSDFNPLPPCGGRLLYHQFGDISLRLFQSTPSVWRETRHFKRFSLIIFEFQSTPSVWRETTF